MKNGVEYPYKLVHAGPRTSGLDTFFPDGAQTHWSLRTYRGVLLTAMHSFNNPDEVDEVDP